MVMAIKKTSGWESEIWVGGGDERAARARRRFKTE